MLSGNPLGHLAWEPCIGKHDDHYDDPWQESRRVTGGQRGDAPVPVRLLDFTTGETTDYTSIGAASLATGHTRSVIANRLNHGTTVGKYLIYRLDKDGEIVYISKGGKV